LYTDTFSSDCAETNLGGEATSTFFFTVGQHCSLYLSLAVCGVQLCTWWMESLSA